jgi:hypothetical protein
MRQDANGRAALDDIGRNGVAQLDGCRRVQHHDVRVALPRGTIDQDGESTQCKLVRAGLLPAVRATAALNFARAADLDNLACTPTILEIAMLLVEVGAARQADADRRTKNPACDRMRRADDVMFIFAISATDNVSARYPMMG